MQSWGEDFEDELSEIFTIERRIAFGMATRLSTKLTGPQRQSLAQDPSRSAEAYEYYLRGKMAVKRHRDRESLDLAFDLLQGPCSSTPTWLRHR